MKTSMNLLPVRCLWWNLLRVRARQWSLVCLVVLLVSTFAYYRQYAETLVASHKLAALERLYAPVKVVKDDLKALQATRRKIEQHQQKVTPLIDHRPLLTLLGHISQSAAASGTKLRIANFQFRRGERTAMAADQAAHDGSPSTLSLQGEADDYVTVMKFVSALRDTKAFLSAELKSTARKDRGHDKKHTFLVECNF